MARGLLPLLGEVVADELRRLAGRQRPTRYPSSPAPAPPDPPSQSPEARDPWAAHVAEYAQSALAGELPRPALRDGGAPPFEDVDLGLLPDAIAHIVRLNAPVPQDELVHVVGKELLLGNLPANYERLLGRFVWSAKGRGLIDLREGSWVAGRAAAGTIPQLDGQSLDRLASMAGELREEDEASEDGVFRAMLADLAGPGERAPRIVAIAVGAAIGLARRRGDLPRDRWGQLSLPDGADA